MGWILLYVGLFNQFCTHAPNLLAQLKQYCEAYHKRIAELENKKFDLEKEVEFRDFQVELGGD